MTDPIDDLYAALTKGKKRPRTVRELPNDEKREYTRQRVEELRQRQRKSILEGTPEPTADNVRTALADAALAILAVDGPGSDQIRTVLDKVFSGKPGVSLTVTTKAKSGRLKPKLLKL